MPYVALAALALIALGELLSGFLLPGYRLFDGPLRYVTIPLVLLTIAYYGLSVFHWVTNRLLWRVRRRLLITYLFVGLTPIVLLSTLAMIAGFGVSAEAMTRIVTVEVDSTVKSAGAAVQALFEALRRRAEGTKAGNLRIWMEDRMAPLQGALPGARVALWQGEGAAKSGIGEGPPALTVGTDAARHPGAVESGPPLGAALPGWLRERDRWSGLVFQESPAGTGGSFSTPLACAYLRGGAGVRSFSLLLAVPFDRPLIQRYRDTTGLRIHPFFLGASGEDFDVKVGFTRTDLSEARDGSSTLPSRDQFGDTLPPVSYPVILPFTHWESGRISQRLTFLFQWSPADAIHHLLGGSLVGPVWRIGLVVVGLLFLALELIALLAAGWMTRAVTGTVHDLHVGTEHVERGDFSHRIRVRSKDQLGELVAAFNQMAGHIEALLRESIERERLQSEVDIAARTQSRLFPRAVPRLATAELSGECRAASGVAGDYYDFIEVVPGLVTLALGDVAGKGLPASLLMSTLQACLRAQTAILTESVIARASSASASVPVGHVGENPTGDGLVARLAASVNAQLCRSTEANRYATLFVAVYDDATRLLRYTNAGHNAPILVRPDGTVERLSRGGTIVGAFESAAFEEDRERLEPASLVVAFSDGISEARNRAGEEYGEERLARLAVAHRHLSADEMRKAIFAEMEGWSGGVERGDDQTLLVLKARIGPD